MNNFKYENIQFVELKKDIELFKHDEKGNIEDTLIIKKGTKGELVSMEMRSPEFYEPKYEIIFETEKGEAEVIITESEFENYLLVTNNI
ncbi:hypothetical protein AXJ14_gp118 [Geobacillus virus E3]|uniref:hypothetical protein n=1 Tax=Geobacillus virus E3 TaxID=1572712 RepID=UPI0006719D29|nr:hypothetical protein AXJ14_gp118 [Geobacillus virus E3]AJA41437.1 hypothetical protein E3_0118 [Geobacillus virus E3]